jgi:hypothetical protein
LGFLAIRFSQRGREYPRRARSVRIGAFNRSVESRGKSLGLIEIIEFDAKRQTRRTA